GGQGGRCRDGPDGPLTGRMHAPAGRLLVFDSHASSPRRKCRLQQAARPSEVITLVRKRLLCDRNVPGAQRGRSLRAARFSETTGTDRAVILGVDVRAGKLRYSQCTENFKEGRTGSGMPARAAARVTGAGEQAISRRFATSRSRTLSPMIVHSRA